MKTVNVIGAGRVGRTLAALFEESGSFAVQDVLSGSIESARAAVRLIGSGHAVDAHADMRPAHVWVIATPDRAIAGSAQKVAAAGRIRSGDVVFHCSGSLTSDELAAAAIAGAATASVHPLKTFADPRDAMQSFAGTYCVAEGEASALSVLRPAFERIGAVVCEIEPASKTLYHAASVVVCNYLTALMETGLRCFEQAGLERANAARMMAPLVRETLDNVLRLGTADALTGPVARADEIVVARHLDALDEWDARIAAIYRNLGAIAVELARARGEADAQALARIEALLARR